MDITLIPVEVVTGIMPLSSPEARSFKPKAWGIEGPVISASRIAVLYPCFCICTAKREVTKDLPTTTLAADNRNDVFYVRTFVRFLPKDF